MSRPNLVGMGTSGAESGKEDVRRVPAPSPSSCALFLDVDGTLLDIAATPDASGSDAHLIDTVRRLHDALGGALALVSGRPITDVDRLFAPLLLPVAGQHGAERRDGDGRLYRLDFVSEQFDALRRSVVAWADSVPGLLVEDKGLSLAVHFRQVPERADEVRRALQRCLDSAGQAFHLQPGKMVLEVLPGGSDKGTAILAFMAEAPFLHRLPVFLGDDVTDEHGFAMVHRLGGRAIKVGHGASQARERLADVVAVRTWLERMLEDANPTA